MRRRALLVCLLLLPACTAQEPAPEPPAEWQVEVGTAPTLLALTDEQVYGASFGNGVGGSQVYRVDRATGRLVAQRTLAGEPNGMAVGPDGALWLATVRLPDQPTGTGLQVLDPGTLQTWRRLDTPDVPQSLVFLDGQLWVGGSDAVRRLDPATGTVLASVGTQVRAYRLHVLDGDLLAVGPEGLQRIDVATGTAGPVRRVEAAGGISAVTADDLLWVLHPDASAQSVLQRYDAASLAPGAVAASPGRAGASAFLTGDVLWVTDPGGGRLLCADPATGAVRDVRELPLTGPVVADRRTVVVAQAGGLAARPATCGGGD